MRKRSISGAIVVLGLVVLLAACGGKEDETADTPGGEKGSRLVAYASNYPLKYFAERIGGPLVEVRFPASASGDPAYWEPTPEDVAAMQQADLIMLNGAMYEQWVANVSLPESRLVDTTAGLEGSFIALEGGVTHSHGPEGAHEHSGTAFTTWMDLAFAVMQAEEIKDALAARLPEHGGQLEEQFTQLARELAELDESLVAAVSGASGHSVVFSHPVYQYFERRYGVHGHSVHWEPDQMPDEAMWAELKALQAEHSVKWMIWEGEPLPEVVAKLKELGVQSAVVDPCGNEPDDGDFAAVMARNISALSAVFSAE